MFRKQLFDSDGKLLRWLYWDDAASTLMGVPTKKDVGRRVLSVKVVPKHDVAETKDLFVVQVIPEKHEELKHRNGKVSSLYIWPEVPSSTALPGFIVLTTEALHWQRFNWLLDEQQVPLALPLPELIVGTRNLLASFVLLPPAFQTVSFGTKTLSNPKHLSWN